MEHATRTEASAAGPLLQPAGVPGCPSDERSLQPGRTNALCATARWTRLPVSVPAAARRSTRNPAAHLGRAGGPPRLGRIGSVHSYGRVGQAEGRAGGPGTGAETSPLGRAGVGVYARTSGPHGDD